MMLSPGVRLAGKRARERAPPLKAYFAMAQHRVEDAANAAHPRINGSAPRRREHVDRGVPFAFRETGDERLRENRIADPRRRDDENGAAHCR